MATRCTSWLLLLTGMHLSAQYVINTVAGGGAPQNVPATSVGIGRPAHIAVDGSGNIHIASDTQNRIYKVDATGTLTTVAGNSGMASASDPGIGPALNTAVYPGSIALDQAGNLYIAGLDCCVLKINNGVIARADGNGTRGFSGDGGPASSAAINPPAGIVFDSAGNLYLSDIFTQRIRKISNGVITTVAGNGTQGFSGDGATATAASLALVASSGLAVDSQRNLYIADSVNYRIRKVTNGIITTIAGGGTSFADNIPATSAMLGSVGDIAVDAAGNLYISNSGSGPAYFPREVMNGTITTFTNSAAYVSSFAADNTGNLYFADYSNQVRRISNGVATIVAGNGDGSYIGDGTVATNAGLATPNSVAVDRAGNVYIADSGNHRIRRVTGGQITTVATTTTNANQCSGCPGAVAVDGSGNVYFTDGFQVRVISNGVITTVAGNGSGSYSGDGGPATSAGVFPTALAVDSQNDLYIADVYRIRKVSQGVITTVAGNGTPGSCATPVLATGPSVANYVAGVSIDSSGNIYFANSNAGMGEVCRVSNGTATSVANSSTPGFRNPSGIARDQLGNVFIVSPGIVWKLSNGILTNIAGTPSSYNVLGYSGDGGPGTSATLGTMISSGLAVDIASNIYVADSGNNRVRILSPTGFGSPFGSFDTPLDNTTGVAGAIPVTGWALDKVGVSKVQVWREPVGNEPVASNNLVFVGDAVQVAGTRPDVQALYPTMPFNNRAGWGYMLLTNFLPSTSGPAGNGTYKLHAIATNNAGGQTDLGTRTIVVDNVHASKPFGTIDTPGQGAAISGNAYVNFGWALTQNPYCIPTDGHTITVAIDGVLGGHPTYNQNRSDIATLFPGLCNSNGAVGFFYIDTTTLANGVHTISWVVYDNQGRGDGIGSRYFTVQNAGNIAAPQESALAALKASPMQGRPYIVEVEELDRIELDLGAISSEPLPVGSTLKNGVFYWQLGPGFLGEYQFRFTRPDGSSALVQVKVHPKSYNRY